MIPFNPYYLFGKCCSLPGAAHSAGGAARGLCQAKGRAVSDTTGTFIYWRYLVVFLSGLEPSATDECIISPPV